MCRLLYLPRNIRPSFGILKEWLAHLDKSNGGDGCGYATTKTVAKGVLLTPLACAKVLSRTTRPVIWHTRKISCGMKSDHLCHPFNAGGNKWLVHNGHWHDGAIARRYLRGEWSDSAIGALHVKLYGWQSFVKHCDRGVWMLLGKRGLSLHYQSGVLYKDTKTGALCSEACSLWGDWRKVAYGTYGVDEEVKVQEYSVVKTVPVVFDTEKETMDWLRNKVDWQTQLFRGTSKGGDE